MPNRRKRPSGFSLTELSFVLTIALILTGVVAGGGSYLLNASKGRGPAEFAKETMSALIQFESRRPGTRFPRPADQTDFNSGATHGIGSFYNSTTGTQYYNPYKGANANISVVSFPAGGTNALVEQADYPLLGSEGDVFYFFKSTVSGSPILVWDGSQMRPFEYYAVQAIDERGHPLATLGR